MDVSKIDKFLVVYEKYFPRDKIMWLREKLINIDETTYNKVIDVDLRNPTTAFWLSFILGEWGLGRFYIGDVGLGTIKILTGLTYKILYLGKIMQSNPLILVLQTICCLVCGTINIIDWFKISKRTKEKNFQHIMEVIY